LFTKRWEIIETKGKIPKSRYKHEIILLPNGNLFLIGGISGEERFLDTFEFNIETKTWSQIPLIDTQKIFNGRYGFSAISHENHLYIFGVFLNCLDKIGLR